MRLFNRQYLLQIGDAETGDGLSINDLQITFSIRKSINNKSKIDRATITICNLSDQSLAVLEADYSVVVFSCGYLGDVVRLFFGEVTDVETNKKGPDRATKIDISPAFTELTHSLMSELVPEGGNITDAIEAIRKQTGLAKGVYKGANLSTEVIYGYPLQGSPRQMLDQVCEVYNLQWRTDGEALYINDSESVESTNTELAPVISVETGLIDQPFFITGSDKKSSKDETKKAGVRFTALLNPNVTPGTLVRVDYKEESNYYKVEEVHFEGDFRGNKWYMTCTCSRRPEA